MIRTFSPKLQNLQIRKKLLKKIDKVIISNNYILGSEVKSFEKNFLKFHNAKFAVSTKNGTDSLSIALRSLNIKKGDEVITTAHSALATVASIISVGAKPVIVDIEKDFYTIDPQEIITAITKKTKAIISVHIHGQICDMKKIINISKKYNLPIIEDCAQSIGSKLGKKFAGTFGQISCFSFYPTKNLGAVGDGGMIITKSKKLYNKILKLRQYGWNKNRKAQITGINTRLDEIQASILNIKIKKLKKFNQKRNKIASIYKSKILNQKVFLPKVRNNSYHSFHIYPVLVDNRKKFLDFLKKRGINLTIHYNRLTFLDPGYRDLCKYNLKKLTNAINLSQRTVSLPMFPELTNKEIKKIIKIINSYETYK
tara:strand:- start:4168 stop:5274 length:1107 start_codon:yes stop_codon:yes gene_type:complete